MLKALGMEHWMAKELACSRKGYWRMAKVLNQIFSNKIIAKLGYTSMLDYYLVVCENERTAVYGTVRWRDSTDYECGRQLWERHRRGTADFHM